MWFTGYGLHSQKTSDYGKIHLNQHYDPSGKPQWLVLLKISGSLALLACGYAVVLPSLNFLPVWQQLAVTSGLLMVYVGASFFLRPEPNASKMGWFGGLMDNPFEYADGWNRFLWSLHCFLGPGRLISTTVLDIAFSLGLISVPEEVQGQTRGELAQAAESSFAAPILPATTFAPQQEFGTFRHGSTPDAGTVAAPPDPASETGHQEAASVAPPPAGNSPAAEPGTGGYHQELTTARFLQMYQQNGP